ncbi:heme NO-binding domain-containing protein [Polyangium aurulentum]|uniref:heme NO-binding domain-containing protein n=1 Tax=Polyangium aurulentum TaxID=2567896 RepID=UPI0010ADAACA|nr:heme NO-binding domain-containing protein [Polyangium aurulentum]UQA62446.1 heme NO-binding domain-containing protein [Polyangium aurulentum]
MQGVILVGLRKFVRERLGDGIWRTVQEEAGVTDRVYLPVHAYPDEELIALVESVSRVTGMSTALVLESFGDYIVGDLLKVYSSVLDPSWKMLDILTHCDEIMARANRRHYSGTPVMPVKARLGSGGDVVLIYSSPLRLCALLKGVVRGLGSHLEQPVVLEEICCAQAGANACEIAVRLERAPKDAELRAKSLRRRLTPAVPVAAVKSAMLGQRSEPPPPSSRGESSGWRARAVAGETSMTPPASGVISIRSSEMAGDALQDAKRRR